MQISSTDLEHQLSLLQQTARNANWGLFGTDSMLWKINRESAVLLGAERALLLQLSHPLIAAAVAEHSNVLNNPLKRLHHTFGIMFKMVFGTIEQSCEAARILHRRHSFVQGRLPENNGFFRQGTPYQANDAALLQWVHSTLVDSAYLVYASTFAPLSAAEREQYYHESCRMAGLFGLTSNSLPPTWAQFREYMDRVCQSDTLVVSPLVKDLLDRILDKHWRRVPNWYQAITVQMLPPPLRESYELPYGEIQQIKAKHAWKLVRQICSLMPYHLRYVGPYQEALARIERRAPGLVTNAMNHLWIGRSTL
jgi:uncharacterized protein (DUF2236 family)